MIERRRVLRALGAPALVGFAWQAGIANAQPAGATGPGEWRLPAPAVGGSGSVEDAVQRRRSVRAFADRPLALADAAQLLWSAQGRTDALGHRSTPSAGALYPLEVWLVAGRVDGLAPGTYRYRPSEHALTTVAGGDRRDAIAAATRGQAWVAQASLILVVVADLARTAERYGDRAERFVAFEAGAAAQNVALQCTARGWATVPVGAFDESRLRAVLGLPADRLPLVLLPVGWPR